MRNNILLTFSDFNQLYEIGIYKEKNNRELIPVEDIDFINLKVKELARNLCSELKANKIKIYNHESELGLLNHIGIRNNEVNNFLLEFYIKYLDQQFLNFLLNFPWKENNVTSVSYQVSKNKDFRSPFISIYGDFLYYFINGYRFAIRAGCFFQTNNKVLVNMYTDIKNIIPKNKNYILLDLYCGIGIVSILLSRFLKKTIGIEVNSNSIEMARYNSKVNNCDNTEFICSEVENALDKINYDNCVVFINPPRRGLYNKVIDKIKSLKNVKQILYLSCCKKTLFRDLNYFNCSYLHIATYDMFPGTEHKEFLVKIIL